MEKVKATEMQKILPRTRVIMRRVQWIFKIRRRRKWFLRMAVKLKTPKRATTTLKTTVRKQKVIAMKRLASDHAFSLYLYNLFSGGGQNTFLSQIPRKKP